MILFTAPLLDGINTEMKPENTSPLQQTLARSAGLLLVAAVICFLLQRLQPAPRFSFLDLEWWALSLGILLLNFRSWHFFVHVLRGSKQAVLPFLILKLLAVSLLILLLILGRMRALLIFACCLILFLFCASLLHILAARRTSSESPEFPG